MTRFSRSLRSVLVRKGLAITATAMALSSTLVLYSPCVALVPSHDAPAPWLRPCLSSFEKQEMARRRSQQKRMRFADDVVDKDNNGAAASAPREAEAAEPSCAGLWRSASALKSLHPPGRPAPT